jgi:nucleotide-binding universal stress UspA family protein
MSARVGKMCTSPSRILVATDLRDLKQILPVAVDYALEFKASLKLIHIISEVNDPDRDPNQRGTRDRGRVTASAARILENAAKKTRQAGVTCTWVTQSGQVAETMSQMVRQWKSDWVVVGSHGIEKRRQNLLGSVAQSIFHGVDVPVLAIGAAVQSGKRPPFRKSRILFAAALTRESRAVAEFVLQFAEVRQAELTMLYVIPEIAKAHPSALRVHAYAEGMFNEILSGISEEKPHPFCVIERGQVVETILRVASDGHFDLIILGGVSGSSFHTDIMPGTSYGVICGAPCPVLMLKGGSHQNIPGSTPGKLSQSELPALSLS